MPLSKSGQRTGAVESILLTDVYVLHLLKNFIEGMHSGDRLSNVSPGLLRSRLASLLDINCISLILIGGIVSDGQDNSCL